MLMAKTDEPIQIVLTGLLLKEKQITDTQINVLG
jgi:hypothetical protein